MCLFPPGSMSGWWNPRTWTYPKALRSGSDRETQLTASSRSAPQLHIRFPPLHVSMRYKWLTGHASRRWTRDVAPSCVLCRSASWLVWILFIIAVGFNCVHCSGLTILIWGFLRLMWKLTFPPPLLLSLFVLFPLSLQLSPVQLSQQLPQGCFGGEFIRKPLDYAH